MACSTKNKRLAYMAGVIFLRENGHPLPAEQSFVFAKHIEGVLQHTEASDQIASWLQAVLDTAAR
jgi:prophage maintenance system killer protein